MSFTVFPKITNEKPTKERILELVRVLIYTLCFFGILLHLTGIGANFWPVVDRVMGQYAIYAFILLSAAAILFLVISKKARKIKEMNIGLFFFFAVMTVLVVLNRGAKEGAVLYLLLIPIILLPADEREVKKVRRAIYNAGVMVFAAFLFMYFRSGLKGFEGLDELLILETTLAFLAIIHSKDVYGRFRLPYILSFLWFAGTIFFAVRFGGIMYYTSAAVLLLMLFVFGFRKTAFPALTVRILVLISVLLLVGWVSLICYSKMLSVGTDKEAAAALFEKTPIKNNAEAIDFVTDKIVSYNTLSGADSTFVKSPVLMLLNTYSGEKLGIWKEFLANTTFTASSEGVAVKGVLYESSENRFVQTVYNYGFLAGCLNLIFFFVGWIASIAGYIKTKKELYFAPFVILTAAFGVWMNSAAGSGSVMTFLAAISMIPVIGIKPEEPKEENQ